MAADILIVDDERDIRELVAGILGDEGHGTRTARDADDALNQVSQRRPSLVLLDIWLQGSRLDGLELLDVLKEQHPDVVDVVWKWERWHHSVDYSPFKRNELRLKPGVTPTKANPDYGLHIVRGGSDSE